MSSDWEKKVNQEIENGANAIINEIANVLRIFFFRVGLGFKKSWKNKKLFIGFFLSFLIPIAARIKSDYFLVDTKFYFKIIYFLTFIAPLFYMVIVSFVKNKEDKRNAEYRLAFEQLNFVGADSKTPILKSFIAWKSYIPQLQTSLNISIISIEQGASKRIVIIKSMAGDAKIPKYLPWDDKYIEEQEGVVVVGQTFSGNIKIDLNKSPHILSAGETGSGKSVILRCILWQLLKQGAIAYMVDFKGGVEFGLEYEKVGQVITEVDAAEKLFKYLVDENAKRLKLLRESGSKNIGEYNKKFEGEELKRIIVVIDELAELMDKTGVDDETRAKLVRIEGYTSTLARLSRATGINLCIGVQRPDAKVITGQIKNNVPVRICGRFADSKASEIVLSNTKAKDLPEVKGRFLFKLGADTVQFQAFYFDDDKHFIPNKILKLRKDEIEDKKVGLDLNKEKLIDNDLMNSVNEKFEIKEVKSMDSNIENEDDSKFENFEEQNKTENLKSTINDDYE
ncbi:FtsK/SpoIIIE domain-containing protein [Clostridium perfringens]|uniref:DNA translocase coupling protein TcpA n=1 Tax=Clostridium perfringens TaxID=1502 RepID=UPI000D71195E|nr:toxin coregulated pilin subunit precursor TcpA [Clostridium perfringens]